MHVDSLAIGLHPELTHKGTLVPQDVAGLICRLWLRRLQSDHSDATDRNEHLIVNPRFRLQKIVLFGLAGCQLSCIPPLLLDVPSPVFILDTDGAVTELNSAAVSEYGWGADLKGREFSSLVPLSELTAWHHLLERCRGGEEIRAAGTFRIEVSGTVVSVDLDLSRIVDDAGCVSGFVVRDSQLSRAVDDGSWVLDAEPNGPTPSSMLRESEARVAQQLEELNQLYATAPIGLALVDRDLRFTRINETLAEINGRPVGTHLGRTVREVIPEIADVIEPLYRRVFETGEPLTAMEIQAETASQPGVLRDWLVSCHPLKDGCDQVFAVNAIVQEVTERRRAEEQLRQSENQLRMILDGTTDGFWDFDLRTNQAICSDASKVLSGTTAKNDSWLQCLSRMVHGQDRHRFEQVVRDHLDRSIPLDGEFRFVQNDDQWLWQRCRGKAVRDDEGEPIRIVGINIDISESKALEQLLMQQAEVERVQLSRELHDSFGQEISGIAMMVAKVRHAIAPDDEVQTLLKRLERHIETAKSQVRALAKGLFPVDVDAAGLSAALRGLVEETDELNEFQCQFECSPVVSVKDNFVATQLFLIAREALHNAVRHSEAQRIVVRLRNREGIVVEVEDDGIGTEADLITATGLGLRIMRHRASRIQATLQVQSKPSGGVRIQCRYAPATEC